MRVFRMLAVAMLALQPVAALAYDTPEALIEALYAPYMRDEIPEDQEPLFSERLQGLFDADAVRTPEGEMGAIEFDPFINGQDWTITNFEVVDVKTEGDTAAVEVTFMNYDQANRLVYDLVEESDGWKIDDVASPWGEYPYRLSEILAAPAQ